MMNKEGIMQKEEERPLKGCAVEGRNVAPVECRCPECGHEVELFSDELETPCTQCGKDVTMEVCAV